MEHTLALIELAHEGDKEARDTIINENMGLVWSIVKRFANRGGRYGRSVPDKVHRTAESCG